MVAWVLQLDTRFVLTHLPEDSFKSNHTAKFAASGRLPLPEAARIIIAKRVLAMRLVVHTSEIVDDFLRLSSFVIGVLCRQRYWQEHTDEERQDGPVSARDVG